MSHLCFGVVAYIVDVINIMRTSKSSQSGNLLGRAFNALWYTFSCPLECVCGSNVHLYYILSDEFVGILILTFYVIAVVMLLLVVSKVTMIDHCGWSC